MYMAISPGGSPGDVVIVSGAALSTGINFESPAEKTLKVDNDGNIYQRNNTAAYNQIATSTDWIRPTTSAPGLYEVRFTNKSGDTIFTTKAEDVWHDISTGDFTWIIQDTTFDDGANTATFTVEIRLDGGAVLDSAAYTISANLLT